MERKTVKIKHIAKVNYNVVELTTEKPVGYTFKPGQATEISISKDNWKDEKRPFTFTSLPDDEHLQFTIKIYPSHDGVTEQISKLKKGDELIIGDVFGAIQYKGEGTFIAGGAGVTPFISILKSLNKANNISGNTLLFANQTRKDIFLERCFNLILGQKYINVLSQEKTSDYQYGHIDKAFLQDLNLNLSNYFYVCGPPEMTENLINVLRDLGVEKQRIVAEDFDS